MPNILILSLPRSGSSLLCRLVESAHFRLKLFSDSEYLKPSCLNQGGYREEVRFTLLNDQLLRLFYDDYTSFLYTKRLDNSAAFRNSFIYDIHEDTLWMPEKFNERLLELTGNSWDVWGLTRMTVGRKWYRCYSAFGLDTEQGVMDQKKRYEVLLNSTTGYVLKDPRLALTLHLYDFNPSNFKVVIVNRNLDAVLSSCRSHYGPNIFSMNDIDGTEIVTNHFNYKIKFQSFDDWLEIYERSYTKIKSVYNTIEVNYENIINRGSDIRVLQEFIGADIDSSLINIHYRSF